VLGLPTRLGSGAWVEDVLTDFDEYVKQGLWFVTPEGHVVVGRSAGDTLQEEHEERFWRIFVRSREPVEAGYVFRARVVLLTPYVSGAIVFGHRRKDRNVRLYLEAGDRPRPDAGPQKRVQHRTAMLRLSTRRPFDGIHRDGEWTREVKVDPVLNSFDLAVRVEGSRISFSAEGEELASLVDAEGMPVDGAIGFASGGGAFRVESPAIERTMGRGEDGASTATELDLAAPAAPIGRWVVGRRVHGVTPARRGTVLHWFPLGVPTAIDVTAPSQAELAQGVWEDVLKALDDSDHAADLVVVLPNAWPDEWKKAFRAAAAAVPKERGRVLEHAEGTVAGTPTAAREWGQNPHLLYVDPVGTVRLHSDKGWATIPSEWASWLRITRGW
jgi:hypothetical protein